MIDLDALRTNCERNLGEVQIQLQTFKIMHGAPKAAVQVRKSFSIRTIISYLSTNCYFKA